MSLLSERAIPRRLIAHLFGKLPLDQAEAAVNRFIEAALPGPVAWFEKHVTDLHRACLCSLAAPGTRCDLGDALFRVSANHRARRAA